MIHLVYRPELWVGGQLVQCPSSSLHEVSGCTCTGLTSFVVVFVPVIAVEGVVVVKEVASCAIFSTVLVVLCGTV